MSKFSRLFDLASRAVDKAGSSRSTPTAGSGGDWRDLVRSAADAVTGDGRDSRPSASDSSTPYPAPAAPRAFPAPRTESAGAPRYAPPAGGALSPDDRAAIARYDYLLRTASPDQVELLHREAFERLTPAQRAHVRSRMDAELAPHERPRSDSAADLARTAGRAEAQRPGRMSQLLARAGRGGMIGAGVLGAGGLLAAVAGGAVVSAIAAPLLAHAANAGVDFAGLAEGVDLEGLAAGVDVESLASGIGGEAIGEWAGGAQDAVSGVGDHISGIGDRISGFEIPGLGDFFGR